MFSRSGVAGRGENIRVIIYIEGSQSLYLEGTGGHLKVTDGSLLDSIKMLSARSKG